MVGEKKRSREASQKSMRKPKYTGRAASIPGQAGCKSGDPDPNWWDPAPLTAWCRWRPAHQ